MPAPWAEAWILSLGAGVLVRTGVWVAGEPPTSNNKSSSSGFSPWPPLSLGQRPHLLAAPQPFLPIYFSRAFLKGSTNQAAMCNSRKCPEG